MIEAISTDNIEELQVFKKTDVAPVQADREEELQTQAGIENSREYETVRSQMAAKHYNEENENLYMAAEMLMKENPLETPKVVEALDNYAMHHGFNDLQSSLEEEAAANQLSNAYIQNPNTAINATNLAFTGDSEAYNTKAKLLETSLKEWEDYANSGTTWKDWYQGALELPAEIKMTEAQRNLYNFGMFLPAQALEASPFTIDGKRVTSLSYNKIRNMQIEDIALHAATMSSEDFSKYLKEIGTEIKKARPEAILQLVDDLRVAPDRSQDLYSVLEVSGMVDDLLRFGGKSAATVAKNAGNTKVAKEVLTGTVVEGTDKGTIIEDIVSTTATKPFQNTPYMSYSNKVADEVAPAIAEIESGRYVNITALKNATEEEMNKVRAIIKDDIEAQLKNNTTEPTDILAIDVEESAANGMYNAKILLGTGMDGNAAMDVAAAQNMAKRLGFAEGEYNVVRKDGEGLYLQVVQPISEDQFTRIGAIGDNIEDFTAMGFMRYFGGSTHISEKAHTLGVASERQLITMRNILYKDRQAVLKKCSKDEKKMFSNLKEHWQKANDGYGAWPTEDEVTTYPKNVQDLFKVYKTQSDLEYIFNNDKVLRKLHAQAYKIIDGKIAKEVSVKNVTKENFKNFVIDGAENFKEFEEKTQGGQYRLIKINKKSQLEFELDYDYKLVPASTYREDELPRFITKYAEGGRREYEYGTAFVKQGRSFWHGSKLINGFAKTFRAGSDIKKLQQFADEGNDAIRIARELRDGLIDEAEAQRQLVKGDYKYFNVRNYDDLKKAIDEGGLNIDNNFQVLEDGQKYHYNNGAMTLSDEAEDLEDSLQELIDFRSDRFNKRGKLLTDVNGDETKLASVWSVWDKTIEKAAYTNCLSDLHNYYQRQFASNFRDLVKGSNVMSPEMLIRGQLKGFEELPKEQWDRLRAAMNMQSRYERLSNTPTAYDRYIGRQMQRLARALGNVPGVGRNFRQIIEDFEPAKAARALHFNYTMGWFNSAQFWKQALGISSVVAIHPLRATQAMLAYVPLRLGYAAKMAGKDGVTSKLAEFFAKATGISKQDYNDFLEFMSKASSTKSMGLRQDMSAHHARTVAYNNLKRLQYIAMEEGTTANLVVSDFVAFMEKKGESVEKILGYSDDLFMNMTRASESAFQHGGTFPTQLLAQWTTYPLRMIEAMGNKRLTKAQRIRVLSTQLAMWGVGGTFLSSKGEANVYRYLTDGAGVPTEVASIIATGIIREAMKEGGYEIDEGLHISDLISKELSFVGENTDNFELSSVIPASSSYGHVMSTLKTIANIVNPETTPYDTIAAAQMVAREQGLPTGIKSIAKSYLAYKTEVIRNTKGKVIKEDTTLEDAVKTLIGLKPVENRLTQYMYDMTQDQMQHARTLYEDYIKPYQEVFVDYEFTNGRNDDPQKREEQRHILENKLRKMISFAYQDLKDSYAGEAPHNELTRLIMKGYQTGTVEGATKSTGFRYSPNLMRQIEEQVLQ